MAEVEIRKAKIEDLENIQKIGQLHFVEAKKESDSLYDIEWPFSEKGSEYYKKAIVDQDKNCFIAEIDGDIIGFLNASSRTDMKYGEIKIAELDEIFVKPEYRSKGIGSKLVHEFLKWIKEIGAKRMMVQTFAASDKAINFYKKFGFQDFIVELKKDFEG